MADKYRVSLNFTSLPDSDDDEFCSNVIVKLTGNASFPNLPVSLATLTTQRTTFHTSIAAAMQGGLALTAAKNAARTIMDNSLRAIAAYVQSIAYQDLTLLLSSGFEAVSNNRTSSPLATPTIQNIDNSATEKFFLRLQTVNNAAAYQIRLTATGATNPVPVTVESTSSRNLLVPDLVPGTTYELQSRAIGGSTGYSEWSDPVTKMAT
jgi:hypothetical protein